MLSGRCTARANGLGFLEPRTLGRCVFWGSALVPDGGLQRRPQDAFVNVCQMFWVPCVASQRGRSMKDDDEDAGSLSMSVKTTLTLVTVVGPGCWTRLVDLGAADSSLGQR
ncbi:hypothetical protein V3481_011795 [Fusarium oxysporum f. sp. vasinfectum]